VPLRICLEHSAFLFSAACLKFADTVPAERLLVVLSPFCENRYPPPFFLSLDSCLGHFFSSCVRFDGRQLAPAPIGDLAVQLWAVSPAIPSNPPPPLFLGFPIPRIRRCLRSSFQGPSPSHRRGAFAVFIRSCNFFMLVDVLWIEVLFGGLPPFLRAFLLCEQRSGFYPFAPILTSNSFCLHADRRHPPQGPP